MHIRLATQAEFALLKQHDCHIAPDELEYSISRGRVLIAHVDGAFIGWLRWNLFWDNTPFMNLLFLLPEHRNRGHGKKIVAHWEAQMQELGFSLVMTSTLSNEDAQGFYRSLGYTDAGCLLLKNQPAELLFTKELPGSGACHVHI